MTQSWSKPPVSILSRTQDHAYLPSDYVLKQKALSSKTVTVDLQWQDKKQFAFTVNEHVFNPIQSIVGHKLVDLVLSEKVQVADKKSHRFRVWKRNCRSLCYYQAGKEGLIYRHQSSHRRHPEPSSISAM